jgi:hypothetical protein
MVTKDVSILDKAFKKARRRRNAAGRLFLDHRISQRGNLSAQNKNGGADLSPAYQLGLGILAQLTIPVEGEGDCASPLCVQSPRNRRPWLRWA